jgi:hypothetical protein
MVKIWKYMKHVYITTGIVLFHRVFFGAEHLRSVPRTLKQVDDFPSYKPLFSLGIFDCHVWLPEGTLIVICVYIHYYTLLYYKNVCIDYAVLPSCDLDMKYYIIVYD